MESNLISEAGVELSHWVGWATADYVAARQLLMSGLLVQGAALSNTAIEKALKAIFILAGERKPRSHKVSELYASIQARLPNGASPKLNERYLALLEKSYSLRYPDDLPTGFNITLNQAKLLAQLDRSFGEIYGRFRFSRDGKQVQTKYESATEANDPAITENNVHLNASIVDGFFSTPSKCYEMRIIGDNIMEIEYIAAKMDDDLQFDLQGLTQKNDKQFTLAYLPTH